MSSINRYDALKKEIARHRHVMAGKRLANEVLAQRAIHHRGTYRNFPSDIPGHPGYGMVILFPRSEK